MWHLPVKLCLNLKKSSNRQQILSKFLPSVDATSKSYSPLRIFHTFVLLATPFLGPRLNLLKVRTYSALLNYLGGCFPDLKPWVLGAGLSIQKINK